MNKHTKGPWAVDPYALSVTAEEEQMKICDIRGWGYLTGAGAGAMHLSYEEGKAVQVANARLIAAAPDMLDALLMVLDNCGNPNCKTCRTVRATIAKATGEEVQEVTA